MHRKGTHWTLAMIDELKTRHAAGESAQQIAVGMGLMGAAGYMTRDMVLGKLWRLGMCTPKSIKLDANGHIVKTRPRPRQRPPSPDHPFRNAVAQARRKREVKEQVSGKLGQWTSDTKRMTAPQLPVDGVHDVPGMKYVALEDLERSHCRWPLWSHDRKPWDSRAVRYCGASAEDGMPYCACHASIAYAPCGPINRYHIPGQ